MNKTNGASPCGSDFEFREELLAHWRAKHLQLPEDERAAITDAQVEEEVRKRIFHDEQLTGPFEVCGQEHRRVIGTYATHSTHSVTGSGHMSDITSKQVLTGRALGACVVCARSMWLEDLYEMDLFTRPAEPEVVLESLNAPAPEADDVGAAPCQGPGADATPAMPCRTRQRKFAVHPGCASKVNDLLSALVYSNRWPNIPRHELWASSVSHPHRPGWRWLLHTIRCPDFDEGEEGETPPVLVCHDCGSALTGDSPRKVFMPKYALANDNWIGRMPIAFQPYGERLTIMELKSLARGRMCVHKVIAEPQKAGARAERQGGLRDNTIAFPQARVEHLLGRELPPAREEAARFLSESVVIALAGADVHDLHHAKWAEVRRGPYVDAARFLTCHDKFYMDMRVNETRAKLDLPEREGTTEAVIQQAVPIVASEELKHRLEGPADTGCAGVLHEQAVRVDGEEVESASDSDGCDPAQAPMAIPDPDYPADACCSFPL